MTDAETEVRGAIEALIAAGTTGDVSALDRIYHRDMTIFMLNEAGDVMEADKPAFIAMLSDMVERHGKPMSTWAHIHAVTVTGTAAHVLISRRVEMDGDMRALTLSIDFVLHEGRWQIMREVILNRPLDLAVAA